MSGPTEAQLRDVYGAWAPREPADARALMAGFTGDWWVAGGRGCAGRCGGCTPGTSGWTRSAEGCT